MDINYGTFSPDELMPMIPDIFVAGGFLQLVAFPGVFEFDTAEVYFDRVLVDRRKAPFVAPLALGSVQQPRGFRKENIVPASLKPKNQISGSEVLARMAGERIGGSMSAAERAAAIREMYLLQHQTRINRTREWMAAQLLLTGAVTITGTDYPASVVNFNRTGSLTKTLAGAFRWGQAGISPYDNLDNWMNEVGETSGGAVNIVVMDRLAWQFYAADPKVQKALDRTLGQGNTALTLGLTPTVPGAPIYKGRDGNVEFYVYNDIHDAEDFSGTTKLIPDNTVILLSQGAYQGAKLCGVVQHAQNGWGKGEYCPHNWVEEGTGAEFIETITALILAPARVDASAAITVN